MIFILEDDDGIRNLVGYTLNNSGFEAESFGLPEAFWKAMTKALPDLIILDIMLPQEDGLSILRKLRSDARTMSIPVILLTAKGTEYDKIVGLDSGADDYVTKPFGVMELMARIRALMRRSGEKQGKGELLQTERLTVDTAAHIVRADGSEVALTMKEYELLCLLLRNKGTVLNRDIILSEVWGYSYPGETRTVDVHIRTLRAKLGEAGNAIETIRGSGYKIAASK
ncbi:MAG: response regulator transcription factor [Papillibacter sp.]|nr:response regulator transcription factor [Papillibacter sp.]